MATNYPLSAGTLASDCWPATPQLLYDEMFHRGYVQLDIQGTVISATVPDSTDRDKLWIKVDGSGFPVGQFIYSGGVWIWPHVCPPSGSERRIWVGSLVSLVTYDGGAAGTVAAAGGPMWEEDTAFAGRSPMGVGTLPISGTAITVGNQFGEDSHTMLEAEIAAHTHDVGTLARPMLRTGGGAPTLAPAGGATVSEEVVTSDTGTGSATPMPILHPVLGVYIIKRTARIYHVG